MSVASVGKEPGEHAEGRGNKAVCLPGLGVGQGRALGRLPPGARCVCDEPLRFDVSAPCGPAGPGVPRRPHFRRASQGVRPRGDRMAIPSGSGLGTTPEYGVTQARDGSFPWDTIWNSFC